MQLPHGGYRVSLADDLAKQPTAKEAEFRPRTEFDGRTGYLQTGPLAEPPASHTELLEQFGYDPTEVRIGGPPRVSKWQTYDERWLSAYKFTIVPITDADRNIDDLIGIVNGWSARQPITASGPHIFNFQASDLQIAKIDNGGTEVIIEKFLESVDRATAELRALNRHGIAGVHIMFPGDCIEGNQSQDGRNMWRTEFGVTTQTRILRRIMLYTVEQFAPHVESVWMSTVNGNHDQSQRFQNTNPGDGWATECAIGVSDALKMNEAAFGHVTVEVPDPEQAHMTVARGDTVFTIAHGHTWRRGKAMDWWASQSFHNQNPGGAHVLAHGHFHTFELETSKHRTRICSPTFDGGSNYYRDLTGAEAKRGGLIYLTKSGEVSNLSLV